MTRCPVRILQTGPREVVRGGGHSAGESQQTGRRQAGPVTPCTPHVGPEAAEPVI